VNRKADFFTKRIDSHNELNRFESRIGMLFSGTLCSVIEYGLPLPFLRLGSCCLNGGGESSWCFWCRRWSRQNVKRSRHWRTCRQRRPLTRLARHTGQCAWVWSIFAFIYRWTGCNAVIQQNFVSVSIRNCAYFYCTYELLCIYFVNGHVAGIWQNLAFVR